MATRKKQSEMPEQSQCSICAYWERLPPERDMEDDAGLCRRYPPVVLLDNSEPFTIWPLTEDTDMCGEFRARLNG